jgi:drug/metabolite transporter (DMT)-like permease
VRQVLPVGALAALASAALFGASTPLAKLLLGTTDPQLLAGLLYLGSGCGLALVRPLRRRDPTAPAEAALGRRDWPWLAAAILAGGVLAPVLLLWGLARTPATTASLLLTLEGVLTLGIAWLAFHEPVDRRLALGAAAILGGAALLGCKARPSSARTSARWRSRLPASAGPSTTT